MMDLLDKAVLFVFCTAVYLFEPAFGTGVVPVLLAVAFSSLLEYCGRERLRAALTAGFLALSFFVDGAAVFLPLVCYDLLFCRYQALLLAALVPVGLLYRASAPETAVLVSLLLPAAAWMRYRALTREKGKAEYADMRDETKEMELRLKKQNRELLEKQDYEVRIATLNERNRIARDIHDNVGHLLSRSILQIGALLAVERDGERKEDLLGIEETLAQAMNTIRSSVHALYDESVDLRARAEEMVRGFTFCELTLDYDIRSDPERDLKYAFLSILREALSNIMKHSNASRARVSFREHPALYQLIVSDNGTGKEFCVGNGIGLKNIEDRVVSFGGHLHISTDGGFRIFISIPKERAQP